MILHVPNVFKHEAAFSYKMPLLNCKFQRICFYFSSLVQKYTFICPTYNECVICQTLRFLRFLVYLYKLPVEVVLQLRLFIYINIEERHD
jgi:hypothetical protein